MVFNIHETLNKMASVQWERPENKKIPKEVIQLNIIKSNKIESHFTSKMNYMLKKGYVVQNKCPVMKDNGICSPTMIYEEARLRAMEARAAAASCMNNENYSSPTFASPVKIKQDTQNITQQRILSVLGSHDLFKDLINYDMKSLIGINSQNTQQEIKELENKSVINAPSHSGAIRISFNKRDPNKPYNARSRKMHSVKNQNKKEICLRGEEHFSEVDKTSDGLDEILKAIELPPSPVLEFPRCMEDLTSEEISQELDDILRIIELPPCPILKFPPFPRGQKKMI